MAIRIDTAWRRLRISRCDMASESPRIKGAGSVPEPVPAPVHSGVGDMGFTVGAPGLGAAPVAGSRGFELDVRAGGGAAGIVRVATMLAVGSAGLAELRDFPSGVRCGGPDDTIEAAFVGSTEPAESGEGGGDGAGGSEGMGGADS